MGTPDLPGSLAGNPRLSRWVSIDAGGTVTVRVGKVELGQGVVTALAQVAADELDVDVRRIRMAPASTTSSPDESYTSGSRSIQDSGLALRQACAEVRAILVGAALDKLGAKLDVAADSDLVVRDGVVAVSDGSARISYWDLAAAGTLDRLLDRDADGRAVPKPAGRRTVAGGRAARLDLPDKVTGRPRFVHDLALPGQLAGRVVRPPSRSAALEDVDESAAGGLPGVVAVVRDGRFLGVVAEREDVAVLAADRLRAAASWRERETLPDAADLAADRKSVV